MPPPGAAARGQSWLFRRGVGVERRLTEAVVTNQNPKLITSCEYASRATESAVDG